jgi:hypothetical protein
MSSWSKDPNKWKIRDAEGNRSPSADFLSKNPGVDLDDLPRHNDLPGPLVVKARIEAGWTPSNRVPISVAPMKDSSSVIGTRISNPKTRYLIHFEDKDSARRFVKELNSNNSRVEFPEYEQDGFWTVEFERDGYVDEDFVLRVQAVADRLGGIYDGDMDVSE